MRITCWTSLASNLRNSVCEWTRDLCESFGFEHINVLILCRILCPPQMTFLLEHVFRLNSILVNTDVIQIIDVINLLNDLKICLELLFYWNSSKNIINWRAILNMLDIILDTIYSTVLDLNHDLNINQSYFIINMFAIYNYNLNKI